MSDTTPPPMRFSVVMPVSRAALAGRSILSVLAQRTAASFELILVGNSIGSFDDPRVVVVDCDDINPARRRNRGVSHSRGEILAFIDDDAYARENWLEAADAIFRERPELLAIGGPDPAPSDSTIAELFSDSLLATPYIGSSVAAHECRRDTFLVRKAHDVALVNLFVRRDAFDAAGGFDESIGYIGEDSALLRILLASGGVLYSEHVIVEHRRRAFPGPYLRQRFRYRRKGGAMMVRRGTALSEPKVWALLLAALIFLAALLAAPRIAALLLVGYLAAMFALSWKNSRLPRRWRLLLPFAFFVHHAVYAGGLIVGFVDGAVRRFRSS